MQSFIRSICVFSLASVLAIPGFANSVHNKESSVGVLAPQQTNQTSAININTADVQAIINAHIKGIGKKRAAQIITYRQQHGPFKSIDELKNIKGLSQKVIDANRSRLTVN